MQDTSDAPQGRVGPLAAAESVIGLLFNAIPLIGVLFWGWSPFAVIFLYWLENVAIGARTILSILTLTVMRRDPLMPAVLGAAFFLVHYGLFCLVHGIFVIAFFGSPDADQDIGPLSLVDSTARLLAEQSNIAIGFASIVLWQIGEFIFFLIRSGASGDSVRTLMTAPYLRIAILHATIIFGGFLLMLLGWPPLGVAALVLFKMAYDWMSTRKKEAA